MPNTTLLLNSDAPSTPLRMSEPNLKEIYAVFDNFGPTPRVYFDTLSQHGINSYQCGLNEILAGLGSQDLKSLVVNMGTRSLAADKPHHWHTICLISRKNRDELSDNVNVQPITELSNRNLSFAFGTCRSRISSNCTTISLARLPRNL